MFDPQRIRSYNRRRSYYTRKGQVNQAKAVNIPFTIESNKVQAYKEYLIKNGMARDVEKEYKVDLTNQWNYTKTLWENINESIPEDASLTKLEFRIGIVSQAPGYLEGIVALISPHTQQEILSTNYFDDEYKGWLHQYNTNYYYRNALDCNLYLYFKDDDVFANINTGINPNGEIFSNLKLENDTGYFAYDSQHKAVSKPNNVDYPEEPVQIGDDVAQFLSINYVHCVSTNDEFSGLPINNNNQPLLNHAPTPDDVLRFSAINLYYVK